MTGLVKFVSKHYTTKEYTNRGAEIRINTVLTKALGKREWLVPRFTSAATWISGCMGPKHGPEKEKRDVPVRAGNAPPAIQATASRFTEPSRLRTQLSPPPPTQQLLLLLLLGKIRPRTGREGP